jgi:hypothetical protein
MKIINLLRDLIIKEENTDATKRDLMLLKTIHDKIKQQNVKTKSEIIDVIKNNLPFFGYNPKDADFYYEVFKANFRKDGNYLSIKPEDLIFSENLPSRRVTLSDVRKKVTRKLPFRASNMEGKWGRDDSGTKYYIVTSYEWYPVYLYKEGNWYRNTSSYSRSTGRQMSQAFPSGVKVISIDTRNLENLMRSSPSVTDVVRNQIQGIIEKGDLSKKIDFPVQIEIPQVGDIFDQQNSRYIYWGSYKTSNPVLKDGILSFDAKYDGVAVGFDDRRRITKNPKKGGIPFPSDQLKSELEERFENYMKGIYLMNYMNEIQLRINYIY